MLLLLPFFLLLAQTPPKVSSFHLDETFEDVRKVLGPPVMVADVNAEFRSWQYRFGDIDHDEFSHVFVFRRSTSTLVSISQTFEMPTKVDDLFPAARTTYHQYPNTGNPEMTVCLFRQTPDRLLLAIGSQKPGDPAQQLILIHRSVLPVFYPWLAAELKGP